METNLNQEKQIKKMPTQRKKRITTLSQTERADIE
jgi:hypothetical protein